MTRKSTIEAAFKEAQRQYQAGELLLPDEHGPEDWPLPKFCVWLFNDWDGGAELVEVFCEHYELRYEQLADTAVELERRHFPHIAAVLWKVAEKAKSQVDDIIERQIEPYHRYPEERRRWLVQQWLRGRMAITGQGWNDLIEFYGLKDWFGVATNGAETGINGKSHAVALRSKSASSTPS